MSSTTPADPPLKIRPATLAAADPDLLLNLQDSQIAWLSSIGSSAQWGTEPTRQRRPEAPAKARDWVERSEKNSSWSSENTAPRPTEKSATWASASNDWCRAFIAEAASGVPAAAMVLDCKAPAYVGDVLPERDEKEPFVYLAYLISNRDAGEERRGAAKALLGVAGEVGKEVGVRRICVDCFRGNERKLVRYYESQGFKPLGDFVAGEHDWPGCVLEMRL